MGFRRERPWWKTFLVSLLLTVVPVVGSTMAGIYVYTRHQPGSYRAGDAFMAGVLYLLNIVIAVGLVALIIAIL